MVDVDSKKYYIIQKDRKYHRWLPEYCKCGAHIDSGWLLAFEKQGRVILICINCEWEERYKKYHSSASKVMG